MALSAGRSKACPTDGCVGGVDRMFITERENVTGVTTNADGEVTAIMLASGKVFYEFVNEDETVEFKEDLKIENKAKVVEQSLDVTWACNNTADRKLIEEMAANQCEGFVIIHVEEAGDTAFIWGLNPTKPASKKGSVRLESATRTTGKAYGDANQKTFLLKARARAMAVKFTPGAAGVPLT